MPTTAQVGEIEYEFPDEIGAIPDPNEPERAVGYFTGIAEIAIEDCGSGWAVTGFYLTNTARKGEGFVYIDDRSPLFPMLAAGLRHECESSIEDAINDWYDENGIGRVA